MKSILLIDDDYDILELLEILVNEYLPDYKTILATEANAAINLLKNDLDNQIKLIISDFEMPNGNGLIVYQYNYISKIPFIFHTSSLDVHLKDIEFSEKFKTLLLDKPANPIVLYQKIDEALQKSSKSIDFFPIRPIDALKFANSLTEIFLKINSETYILISRQDFPNIELIKKYYHTKSVENFYVRLGDYKLFLQQKIVPIEDIKEFSYRLILIHENAKHFFSNQEECRIISLKVQEIFKEIHKSSKCNKLVVNILSHGSFTTAHSILMFYIAYKFLSRKSRHSEDILKIFFVACLFHDLGNEENYSKHYCTPVPFEAEQKTLNKISKLDDISETSINLIRKYSHIGDSFLKLNEFEKIFTASHIVASISCEYKIYNLRTIKENYIKGKYLAINSFLNEIS